LNEKTIILKVVKISSSLNQNFPRNQRRFLIRTFLSFAFAWEKTVFVAVAIRFFKSSGVEGNFWLIFA
jgi:hypothetical protein